MSLLFFYVIRKRSNGQGISHLLERRARRVQTAAEQTRANDIYTDLCMIIKVNMVFISDIQEGSYHEGIYREETGIR